MKQNTVLPLGQNRSALSDEAHAQRVHAAVQELNRVAVDAGDTAGLLIMFTVGYGSHGPNRWPVIHHTIARALIRDGVREIP